VATACLSGSQHEPSAAGRRQPSPHGCVHGVFMKATTHTGQKASNPLDGFVDGAIQARAAFFQAADDGFEYEQRALVHPLSGLCN